MRVSTIGRSRVAAGALSTLCALGLAGLVSAGQGSGQGSGPSAARPDPRPARGADASPGACGPAAWPRASACGAANPVRPVRVIAVDAAAAPGRR